MAQPKESIARHWRGIENRNRFTATGCPFCLWVTQEDYVGGVCPQCRFGLCREVQLAKQGTLYSWTRVYEPPAGFEEFAPYYIGMFEVVARIGDSVVKVKVVARITDMMFTDRIPDINDVDQYEAVLRRLSSDGNRGLITYGTAFRLAQ